MSPKIYYSIEYYDRTLLRKVIYMGIGFESKKMAQDEIRRLKRADRKNKSFYGFTKRTKYKIIIRRGIKKASNN